MVDAVSGGARPPLDLTKLAPAPEAQKAKASEPKAASRPDAAPGTSGLTRDIAKTPPVDSAKVASLREQIASGAYKPDPVQIADAMIRMEKGG